MTTEAELLALAVDLNLREANIARKEQEVAAQLSLLQTDRGLLDRAKLDLAREQMAHAQRVAELAAAQERQPIPVKPPAPGGPVVFGSDVSRG
jgi:transcription elongation GreA/GreB family factor